MSVEKQLSIRSSEAADLAAAIADRFGRSQKDVVLEALRRLDKEAGALGAAAGSSAHRLSWERYTTSLERLRAEVREIEAKTGEKITSDHDWLYDENGLPA